MKPTVYFLKPDAYRDVPEAMEQAGIRDVVAPNDFTAVKIHFGEKGNKGYVKPELIKPIIGRLKELGAKVFVTDANSVYRGQRTNAVDHLNIAAIHNFHPKYLGVPVIIADGLRGTSEVQVDVNLKHFSKVRIAETIFNTDVIFSVAHFKGHELCGLGGAIKNLGMGCSSRAGKYAQHVDCKPLFRSEHCVKCGACVKSCPAGALYFEKKDSPPVLDGDKCIGCGQCILICPNKLFDVPWERASEIQEKIAEYAFGALQGKKSFYVNFITFITKNCDCMKTTTHPLMPDVGILLSKDPVAIDQASLDLVSKEAGRDILKEETGIDGTIQIAYAEKLGMGSREYNLIKA